MAGQMSANLVNDNKCKKIWKMQVSFADFEVVSYVLCLQIQNIAR